MKIYNGKPIVKVDWAMKSNGHFETFPETSFCIVDESGVREVLLVALVKSDNEVWGISSEGDTYQNIYEKSEWDPKLVYQYIQDSEFDFKGNFTYDSHCCCVLNRSKVIVADASGIRSSDGTELYCSDNNIRAYMIDDLVCQWNILHLDTNWDIFRLHDYLEDICSKWDENDKFEFDELEVDESNSPRYRIRNSHGIIIAEQGNGTPDGDFVALTQEDGILDNAPWKDLTEEKIKSHLDIWRDFGKDMSQDEIKVACDDNPVSDSQTDCDTNEKESTVIASDSKRVIKEITKPIYPSKWFVCYRVRRVRDLGTSYRNLDEYYDGVFEFDPTDSLTKLKNDIASYQNSCHNDATDGAIDFSNITIMSLTKLTGVQNG